MLGIYIHVQAGQLQIMQKQQQNLFNFSVLVYGYVLFLAHLSRRLKGELIG